MVITGSKKIIVGNQSNIQKFIYKNYILVIDERRSKHFCNRFIIKKMITIIKLLILLKTLDSKYLIKIFGIYIKQNYLSIKY